jgi:hypothetical protein
MSILQVPTYNGKVISHMSLTQPFPGGKKEYEVRIQFNDGKGLTLKSESTITLEDTK